MNIRAAITEINQLKQQIYVKDELISVKDRLIEKLYLQIQNGNQKIYGPRTEKLLTDNQIKLDIFSKEFIPEQIPLNENQVVVEKHTRVVKKGRKALPDNIAREEIVYQPDITTCSCCNAELVQIGEQRSEELEKIPEQFKVIVHVRPKMACNKCKENKVFIAPLPACAFPLEKARPGAGLLSDIVVSKYVDAIPLHRQEEIFSRRGIIIPRQRMSDWVLMIAEDLLDPLYKALIKELLSLSYIQADETTLKVQDGEVKERCHTGYLWGILGPAPNNLVYFHYDKSRSGTVAEKLLNGFKGVVQTDAYAGYNKVYTPDSCLRIACLAHVRRKFIEVQKTAGNDCKTILTLIANLYRLNPADRKVTGKNILDELFKYLEKAKLHTLPRAPMMGALEYALSQREEIYQIISDESFHLDNNAIERQMKKIAIGRKNYLFAGSHRGAHAAAVYYSLLGTCKLNNVNPWDWLKDVITRVSSDKSVTAADLLPHNWKAGKTRNSVA